MAAIVEAERRNNAEAGRLKKERTALEAERQHIDRGKAIAAAAASGDPLAVLKAAGMSLDHGLVYKLAQALPEGEGEAQPQGQPDVAKAVADALKKQEEERQTAAGAAAKQQFLGHVKAQVQQHAEQYPRLHSGGEEAVERVDARFLEVAGRNGGQAPPLQAVLEDIETELAVEEIAGGREQLDALPHSVKRAFDQAMDKYPGIKAEGISPASIVGFARQVARAERRIPSAQQVLDAAEKYWREKYQEKNPYGSQPKPPSPGAATAQPSTGTPGKPAPSSLKEKVRADIEARRAAAAGR